MILHVVTGRILTLACWTVNSVTRYLCFCSFYAVLVSYIAKDSSLDCESMTAVYWGFYVVLYDTCRKHDGL